MSMGRAERKAAARGDNMGKVKFARKLDMLSAGEDHNNSEDSNTSAEEDVGAEAVAPAPDAQIMYSFDAPCAPTQGSQILNVALAKAIDKYEDTQTTKLVQNEYEVLGADADDEENLGLAPSKSKSKAKVKVARMVDAEDEEYEFL